MKKENNASYILRLAVTLLAICAAVALALAGVNAITKDRIDAIQVEKTQKAIAEVLKDGETAMAVFLSDSTQGVISAYENENGYAVEVVSPGFNGDITMMVGVSHDGKVLGISIISHAETAGLGAVAGASSAKGQAFRDSFLGLTAPVSPNKDGGQADTITGATITSRAICDGVNMALDFVANRG